MPASKKSNEMADKSTIQHPQTKDVQYWVDELMGGKGEYESAQPVARWLRNAIVSGEIRALLEPKTVTVSKFEFDISDGRGSFSVALDRVELPLRFTCSIEGNGRLRNWHPYISAPIGLQPSFPCYLITDATKTAIDRAVGKALPPIKPFGIDPVTGAMIDAFATLQERVINAEEFQSACTRIAEPTFSLTEQLQ